MRAEIKGVKHKPRPSVGKASLYRKPPAWGVLPHIQVFNNKMLLAILRLHLNFALIQFSNYRDWSLQWCSWLSFSLFSLSYLFLLYFLVAAVALTAPELLMVVFFFFFFFFFFFSVGISSLNYGFNFSKNILSFSGATSQLVNFPASVDLW